MPENQERTVPGNKSYKPNLAKKNRNKLIKLKLNARINIVPVDRTRITLLYFNFEQT